MKDENTLPIDTSSSGLNARIKQYYNLDQNHINITEDKVELILRDYIEKIKAQKSWELPLTIFLSAILLLITTEKFNDIFGIPAQSWETIIYTSMFASFIWLLYSGWKVWRNRNISIRDIIEAMKKINSDI